MPELPDHPDIDQLRHQARELLRAATAGVPAAVARIRAVSDRAALSTAQLAVAREYGYPSWAALHGEVARRRTVSSAASSQVPATGLVNPAVRADLRYSFGGGAPIQTANGVLSPEVLTVGPGHAELHASGVVDADMRSRRVRRPWRQRQWPAPSFDDLAATDEKGAIYTLAVGSASVHQAEPGKARQLSEVSFWVDPMPPAETAWIELRAQNGSATRLLRSRRAALRVGDLAAVSAAADAEHKLEELAYSLLSFRHRYPFYDLQTERADTNTRSAQIQQVAGDLATGSDLPAQLERLSASLPEQRLADDLPADWQRFLDAATQVDGLARHLDLAAAVPPLEGVFIQLDHLVSRPGSWSLYLRAMPTWWSESGDGHRKWERVSVRASDDLGGRYASTFGGSSGHEDHEELQLEFLPRIDPLARSLKLTFSADAAEAAVDLALDRDLDPDPPADAR
jgi:hypothetical protein